MERLCMFVRMTEVSATVRMDENGRVVIPKSVREALDIEDQSATLILGIEHYDNDD